MGALVKYPGYFESNNGFISDSIFIQDSRYYQAFSYVLKVDERLSSYKSAVKTMLHPAGMALFSEFNINNSYDLSLELESLVRSLGIGLTDNLIVSELASREVTKVISDTLDTPSDVLFSSSLSKALTTPLSTPADSLVQTFGKSVTGDSVTMASTSTTLNTGKTLSTPYTGMVDALSFFTVGKLLSDTPIITESLSQTINKPVTPDILPEQNHEGYVQLNSYYGQDYIRFADEYSVGSRQSTFTL